MLSWEVIESQEVSAIFLQTLTWLGIFSSLGFEEKVRSFLGFGPGLGYPNFIEVRLGLFQVDLGLFVKYFRCVLNPAALTADV